MAKKGYNKKKLTSSKRENFRGKCLFLNDDGKGMVKYQMDLIPVANILPDETALIQVEKRGKYYDTRIQSIIEKSKNRVQPDCQYFYDCGGCQLQHTNYKSQLKYKENNVYKLFKDYGKIDTIISMKTPYRYRNKVIATFQSNGKEVLSGFYKEYSHDIIPIETCIIQDERADKILETTRKLVRQFKYKIYNEDQESGFLRHVLIRTGFNSNEIMVVFVVSSKIFPSKNNFVKALTDAHPEISTIVMNVNSKTTSVVMGDVEHVLYGKGTITDSVCGFDFTLSPKSFFQVNPIQTEKLYKKAMELADIQPNEIVLDTYSGIGTISIIASQYAKQVYGVEINKDAIRNAINNAKANKVKNVRFVESDAGHAMVEMAKEDFKIDTLFMDPPRNGSDHNFLSSTVKLKPKKIVYISCNPVTQARDIQTLTAAGYKVRRVVPVDLFPQTAHVESIVLLSK